MFSVPTSRPGYECSVDTGKFSFLTSPISVLLSHAHTNIFAFALSFVLRAMSVWDTCLQITVACTLIGAWAGAFPIPLDWDRPWQVSSSHGTKISVYSFFSKTKLLLRLFFARSVNILQIIKFTRLILNIKYV